MAPLVPEFHVRKSFGTAKEVAEFLADAAGVLMAKEAVGVKGQNKLSFMKGKPIIVDMRGEYDQDIARLHIHVEQVQKQSKTEAVSDMIELEG